MAKYVHSVTADTKQI